MGEGNPRRDQRHPNLSEEHPRLNEEHPRLGYNHHHLGCSNSRLVDNQPHECHNFNQAKGIHRKYIKYYCRVNDPIPIGEVNPHSMIIFLFK